MYTITQQNHRADKLSQQAWHTHAQSLIDDLRSVIPQAVTNTEVFYSLYQDVFVSCNQRSLVLIVLS